jgi:hypothetical protein
MANEPKRKPLSHESDEPVNPQADLQGMPLKEWLELRQLARTDLEWLCNNVLGMKDVSIDVKPHRNMLRALQQFPGGIDAPDLTPDNLTFKKLRMGYKPKIALWDLPNPSPQRKTMFLMFRGSLKSSMGTVAHKIQWNINYPNIRILISSGTGDQVSKFMSGILQHYRFNDVFRWLFPEFVPWGKVDRFGSGAGMTCLARTLILNEPTFATTSIGSAVAGGHYDVIDHDDVVNEENVRTPESIIAVNEHLSMTAPLLERRHNKPGWTDYIGTRYDYTDAYGKVLDAEKKNPPERRTYTVVFEPAWTGTWDTSTAKAQWPERLGISELKAIENDPLQGPNVLASQYGLIPRPAKSGLIENRNEIIWTPRKVINELYAKLRLHVTIDLHGMAPQTSANKHGDNDYTAITLAGFSMEGHCYVMNIYHGRPSPFEVIDYLFILWHNHPRIIDMKCQKDHMFHTLLPFLTQEQTRRQKFLPLNPIPVNNQISKKQKIKALQPWFKGGAISFADDIVCRFHLEEEIIRFPRFHDDILDTIRDQMENRDGSVIADAMHNPNALPSDPASKGLIPGSNPRFLGFDAQGNQLWEGLTEETSNTAGVDATTGL